MGKPHKSVLVTGATSGIGLAIVRELTASNFEVIATARNMEKASELADALLGQGLTARILICDFEDTAEIDKLLVEVFEIWPTGPWAVINNAGFGVPGAIEDVGGQLAQQQMMINVLAPAQVIRGVLASMRARGNGRIINISSISGRLAPPFMGWYSASKFALEALSDSLRVEVRDFGISVVLIEPSGFASSIWPNSLRLMPVDADSGPYSRAYSKARKITNSNFPEPTPVAKIVRIALESPQPKARYPIGKGTGLIPILRLLPARWLDAVMEINMGLRKPPRILNSLFARIKRG